MNKKSYLIIALIYCISLTQAAHAQVEIEYSFDYDGATRAGATMMDEVPTYPIDLHDYYFTPENLGMSTPQTRDFVKYGNHEVNYYNGLVNIEIPLYGYKDKDFDLPMSIKYISSGFVPSQRPGIAGHNWMLNFGGVIRREVKGSPDDVRGNKHKSDMKKYLKDGLLVAIADGKFRQYPEDDLMSFNVEKTSGSDTPYKDTKYDMESDIFTFSVGQHKGSFVIGNDGKPVLLSGDKQYDININKLTIQNYSLTEPPASSAITITSPDGYKYDFESLEYSVPDNKLGQIIPVHITAWHLTAITAPNKRVVAFVYERRNQTNQYQLLRYEYSGSNVYRTYFGSSSSTFFSPGVNKSTKKIVSEENHFPRMTEVMVNGVNVIEFNYKNMQPFYADDIELEVNPFAIASIRYFPEQTETPIKEEFDYNEQSSNGFYFLSRVKMTDNENYRFAYNLDDYNLPSPLTLSTDHWGFWNGGNIMASEVNTKEFCENAEANRKVSTSEAGLAGLLCKIIYPTGGHTEIKYESNYYTGLWIRDYSVLRYNYSSVDKQLCGGARVAWIRDYDDLSNQSMTRTIKYHSPGTNTESGIIGLAPRYGFQSIEKFHRSGSEGYWVDVVKIVNGEQVVTREYRFGAYQDEVITSTKTLSSNSFNSGSTFKEYFIGYSDVTEYYDDGSYIHYNYSSRKNIKDDHVKYAYITYNPGIVSGYYLSSTLNKLQQAEASNIYELNDLSRFRGILRQKTLYSDVGEPVSRISYNYNFDDAISKYVTCVRSVLRGMAAYKIFLQPCLLTDSEEVHYMSNGEIKTRNTYKYNTYNQLSRIEKIDSDGSTYVATYEYVTDKSNPDNAEKELKKRNILNSLLKVTKTKGSKVIDALSFNYNINHNNVGLPLLHTLSRSMSTEEYVIETYHKYDEYGNPLHITTKDNISSVILWSYKGLYPIAEIKNATYAEVQRALGPGLTPEWFSSRDKPDMDILNKLQIKLPNALITTYEHIPFVGVKAINKYGITDYFEYDPAGRLANTRDDKKNLVNSYNYYFRAQ